MGSVVLSGVCKRFGALEVIKGLDLEIADREFVVFVGPSGCGKSTLLRMIAGLEDITAGEISIDGEVVNELPPARREISMVFQSYALYPHKTVRENIGFGLRMAGLDKSVIREKVDEAAQALELGSLLHRKPKQLSGGQRQRVAIGRAIVRKPKLFLFDEPLSNLDAALRGQMRIELARLHRTLQTTMIFVTHDQVEAMTLADKIVVLNKGRIEQVGTPMDLYLHPANRFVAGFIGSPGMNFVSAHLMAQEGGVARIELRSGQSFDCRPRNPSGISVGAELTVGIRPEDLVADKSGIIFDGRALVIERLGSETHAIISQNDTQEITGIVDGRCNLAIGDAMSLSVSPDRLHLFSTSGEAIHIEPVPDEFAKTRHPLEGR